MLNTKQDFQNYIKNIILPLRPFYSEGGARIKCGVTAAHYGDAIAGFEGFARALWGLVPLWAGGGECEDFDKICLSGIINGTDPQSEEYWGDLIPYNQRLVECAALGLGLILAPHKLWHPLSDLQKENFKNWLLRINECPCPPNNWLFFRVIANLGLKSVGAPYNAEVVADAIAGYESYYIGNGWYTDGNDANADYYIPFAIQFYSLIYAKVMEDEDPKMSKIYKDRAYRFAQDFIYWFDEDGSSVPFGRSLTYRFAQCAFWSACVFAKVEPFPMGVIKGIISRHLEWWAKQPIFDNAGALSIGYAYPNLNMAEDYNAPCSPYWALKSALIAALSDDHEFFSAEPMPLPKLDKLHIIPEARMVIQRINGYVTILTAGNKVSAWDEGVWGVTHDAEKYSKFAYSTKYAFCVPISYAGLTNAGCDSMLAFAKENILFVRRSCSEYKIKENGEIWSKWSPYKGVTVQTTIIPTDDGHKRIHTIECDEESIAYDCAFATPDDSGEIKGGEAVTITAHPNSNLQNTMTKIKAVKYKFPKGTTTVETTVVYPK